MRWARRSRAEGKCRTAQPTPSGQPTLWRTEVHGRRGGAPRPDVHGTRRRQVALGRAQAPACDLLKCARTRHPGSTIRCSGSVGIPEATCSSMLATTCSGGRTRDAVRHLFAAFGAGRVSNSAHHRARGTTGLRPPHPLLRGFGRRFGGSRPRCGARPDGDAEGRADDRHRCAGRKYGTGPKRRSAWARTRGTRRTSGTAGTGRGSRDARPCTPHHQPDSRVGRAAPASGSRRPAVRPTP